MNEDIKLSQNAEIQEALKKFEMESKAWQQQKAPQTPKASGAPKMVGWMIRHSGGLIKEERHAEYILLVLAILMLAVSFYLFFYSSNNSVKAPPISDMLNRPQSNPR